MKPEWKLEGIIWQGLREEPTGASKADDYVAKSTDSLDLTFNNKDWLYEDDETELEEDFQNYTNWL